MSTTDEKELTDWVPHNWTFESAAVAARFEKHVREQLPWYDILTASIVHVGAHYIGKKGLVYDIGASTGNMGRALEPYLKDREAHLISIEQSEQMAKVFHAPGDLVVGDAMTYDFKQYDFAICMLVVMFMPPETRAEFVRKLCSLVKPGGALVIVDKTISPSGYLGTVFRRMAMKWKLDSGTTPNEIIAKELSLGGVQRPIAPDIIPVDARQFFQFGEFSGWIYEKREGWLRQ